MRSVHFQPIVLVLLISVGALAIGCEKKVQLTPSDDPDKVAPPKTAGTVDQLVGTSWLFKRLDMVATFYGPDPPMAIRLSNPRDSGQFVSGYWGLRPNGVIYYTVYGTTTAGTWDGNRLVLGKEEGLRQDGP